MFLSNNFIYKPILGIKTNIWGFANPIWELKQIKFSQISNFLKYFEGIWKQNSKVANVRYSGIFLEASYFIVLNNSTVF